MDRTWSFMTLVVGLPLGLASCDIASAPGNPPPPSGQAAPSAADPTAATLPSGGGTQSGPSAGPEGGATQAGTAPAGATANGAS